MIKACKKHELVLEDPAPTCGIAEHGQSGIILFARAWCKTENYWTVYNFILEEVKREFDANGIKIPFNQLDVHIKQD